MAEAKQNVMTAEGLRALENQLEEHLAKRNEIAAQIEFARGYGDLSENAEYTEAKNLQSQNEEEISRLQALIRTAVVVSDLSLDKVAVGLTVEMEILSVEGEAANDIYDNGVLMLRGWQPGMRLVYSLVGTEEADPLNGKISSDCDIGAGLIGKSAGETFTFVFSGNSKDPSTVELRIAGIFRSGSEAADIISADRDVVA